MHEPSDIDPNRKATFLAKDNATSAISLRGLGNTLSLIKNNISGVKKYLRYFIPAFYMFGVVSTIGMLYFIVSFVHQNDSISNREVVYASKIIQTNAVNDMGSCIVQGSNAYSGGPAVSAFRDIVMACNSVYRDADMKTAPHNFGECVVLGAKSYSGGPAVSAFSQILETCRVAYPARRDYLGKSFPSNIGECISLGSKSYSGGPGASAYSDIIEACRRSY